VAEHDSRRVDINLSEYSRLLIKAVAISPRMTCLDTGAESACVENTMENLRDYIARIVICDIFQDYKRSETWEGHNTYMHLRPVAVIISIIKSGSERNSTIGVMEPVRTHFA
jgi:hypothetical protein